MVGLSPKRFARVLRVKAVTERLARMGGIPRDRVGSMARLAFETGFSDQAHLVRELRAIAGLTPSTYAPVDDQPTHARVETAEGAVEKIFKPRPAVRR